MKQMILKILRKELNIQNIIYVMNMIQKKMKK